MKDQGAIQKFFLDSVSEGEQYLAMQDYENCVRCLTQAVAVCGQPQQLLGVFRSTLPPNVFQMLLANIATLGEEQAKGISVSVHFLLFLLRHWRFVGLFTLTN